MNRRTLIVYYSWSGHTKQLAEKIHQTIPEATLEEIKVAPGTFSSDMYQTSDIANEQIKTKDFPTISPQLENINDYDIVMVGGPVWSNAPSTPVISFLKQIKNFEGQVAPFYTDAGSYSEYEEKFLEYAHGLKVVDGLEGRDNIANWIDSLT